MPNRPGFRATAPSTYGAFGLPGTPLAVLLTLMLLAACTTVPGGGAGPGGGAAPGGETVPDAGAMPPASGPQDFNLVAYQGEAVLGGKEVSFARVFEQGKPVVLNFWAGQCPPCRAEMPEFQGVADEYEDQVIFVGVDLGPFTGLGTHDDALRLLRELDIRYPTAYAVDAAALQTYGIRAMPTTVYLSAAGQVQDTAYGLVTESQLRNGVARLVGS